MCKNDIKHRFNVYTSKETVFVCFAIFKYQLQSVSLNRDTSSVVDRVDVFSHFAFFLPLFVSFFLIPVCQREADGSSSPFNICP